LKVDPYNGRHTLAEAEARFGLAVVRPQIAGWQSRLPTNRRTTMNVNGDPTLSASWC
jgi:hypothetical protein